MLALVTADDPSWQAACADDLAARLGWEVTDLRPAPETWVAALRDRKVPAVISGLPIWPRDRLRELAFLRFLQRYGAVIFEFHRRRLISTLSAAMRRHLPVINVGRLPGEATLNRLMPLLLEHSMIALDASHQLRQGIGHLRPRVILVGEQVGPRSWQDLPFSGGLGARYLQDCLEAARPGIAEVYLLNALLPDGRPAPRAELRNLLLGTVPPPSVIALGRVARNWLADQLIEHQESDQPQYRARFQRSRTDKYVAQIRRSLG